MIRGRVSAADRICLVMNMFGRMVWLDDESFDRSSVEMENARLPVVDPDDGVMVMGSPGKVVRELRPEEIIFFNQVAQDYSDRYKHYKRELQPDHS